ncbi:MAG: Flp family type IVb pilin [Bryobacterales bacterium]|nr:Flp family type IVb pilin [Bryobacterales bacterium]
MNTIIEISLRLKIWKDTSGQDLMENALLGGFLAAASGATLPQLAGSICTVLSKVVYVLAVHGTTAPGA